MNCNTIHIHVVDGGSLKLGATHVLQRYKNYVVTKATGK